MKTAIGLSLLLACATWSAPLLASDALAQKAGCMACHAKEKKLVGPSFKDVAAKYAGDAGAAAQLAAKVRSGGKGVWGQIPMPPNDAEKINDADLKSVVDWILKG